MLGSVIKEEIPEITVENIQMSISAIKKNESTGDDAVDFEAKEMITTELQKWNNATIRLIHKRRGIHQSC